MIRCWSAHMWVISICQRYNLCLFPCLTTMLFTYIILNTLVLWRAIVCDVLMMYYAKRVQICVNLDSMTKTSIMSLLRREQMFVISLLRKRKIVLLFINDIGDPLIIWLWYVNDFAVDYTFRADMRISSDYVNLLDRIFYRLR